MASSIGVLLFLLGGFAMAVGYELISDCLGHFSSSYCWGSHSLGAFGFYVGAIFATISAIMLGAGPVARLLRKLWS